MAIPYTQAQYDALVSAMAEGVTTVKYEDREVTYRSLNAMSTLRASMARALGLETGPHRRRVAHTKGLGSTPQGTGFWWPEGC